MSDVLGDSPVQYYTKEEAKRYELSGAFKRIQTSMTLDALSVLGVAKKSRILDIGCGTGFSTSAIKKAGHEVLGCDVNEFMLEHAKLKGLNIIMCDMKSLPFKDESFDYAVSISTLQWAKPADYPLILSELKRVIKFGAVVQFYPKTSVEYEYFFRKAKNLFKVEAYIIGHGHKAKKYIMLKKRK